MTNENQNKTPPTNENVELIMGNPKKAINKLAGPMIASMLLMMVYNIVDSIWVAGLGADPLAALGFVTPLFMILVGAGTGIGAGANSLISRYIGAKNFKKAGNAGIHTIILSIIVSVIITVVLLVFLKEILVLMGASTVMNYALAYGNVIIICSFTILCPAIFGAILRAEGDIKRATIPMVITAVLNMVLDPIFIYTFNMGIAGAAWATTLASFIGLLLLIYWMFIKKDTYLELNLSEYKTNFKIYKDILIVGIPASLEQFIMSLLGIVINALLAMVAGTTAVAVYTAGWRLISIGVMPAIGVGTAAITVAGAAYGARRWDKLNETCNYSVKVGFIISIVIAILFYIFADNIALIFSYSSNSAALAPLIANLLRVVCLFIIPVPFGVTAGSIFQGVGKGPTSLVLTVIREFILVAVFAVILGLLLHGGEYGIYWGMILGDFLGSAIAFAAIKIYLSRLKHVFID